MNKLFHLLFLNLIPFLTLHSQSLKYVHPQPFGDNLSGVAIIPGTESFMAVSRETHTVVSSTDFGDNLDIVFPLYDDELSAFQDILFIDNQIGLLTKNGEIHKTSDGGLTWKLVYDNTFTNTQLKANANGFAVAMNFNEMTYSEDFGETWSIPRDFGIDESVRNIALLDNGDLWAVANGGVFMKSTDGGVSWNAQKFDADPDLTNVVFAGEQAGFMQGFFSDFSVYTKDGGATWFIADYPGFLSLRNVVSKDGVFWGINNSEVYRSLDSGATWQEISDIKNQFEDPQGDRYNINISDFDVDGDRFVACGSGGMLFSSVDGGLQWNMLTEVISDDVIWDIRQYGNELMTAGQDGTAMFSSDAGSTWSSHKFSAFELQFVDRFEDGRWVVGGADASIYVTDDFGATWSDDIGPGGTEDLTGGAVLPDQSVIITGKDGGLWKSVDRGSTWMPLESPFINPNTDFIGNIDFLTKDYGLIVGSALQVFMTVDGGISWRDISIDSAGTGIIRHVQLIDSSYFILATDNDIYKTTNAGMSYEIISDDDLKAVYINNNGQGIASTSRREVFITEDFGETWTLQSNTCDRQLNTGFVSEDGNAWLVGFDGQIWNENDAFIVTNTFDIPEQAVDMLVYPNPSSGAISIEVEKDRIDFNTIQIFDLLGNVVYEQAYRGHGVIHIDVSLASGTYLVALKNNRNKVIATERLSIY